MANTTNFNWETPDDTDLVKDGAAAMRTLGNSIDTSLVDLKGGTTGQVLAKATNTDMDFTWVAQDDSNAIQNAIVDAKGDLIGATAADTPARLAVGANGTMLVANSAESTGLKWTTATDQFPWQSYTPTFSNFTVGNATVVGRYQQIGKLVNVYVKITWGSTTSSGNYPLASYPASLTPANTYYYSGDCIMRDIGVNDYVGQVLIDNTGLLFCSVYTAGTWGALGVINGSTPATWTTNDIWVLTASYEAA
jgi:hypothetical protein